MKGDIEILAPAGSMESVYAAVRCGADAVYVGGSRYSARANAVNFTSEELSEAVDYCHLHNVRIYQAMNTLVFDSELEDFLASARLSAEMGVDAFIVQDIGAAAMLKQALPDIRLNASTQMSIHTKEGALLAKELGYSRVVVSRELSLDAIREICTAGIEVEVFVHGALCMSVSGQCYMSALIGSRSADRGLCAQACRLPFSAIKGERRNDLSLKDLSNIEHIGELKRAGVSSLKIEGRMKRAEYVAAAVTACRAAVDGEKPDMDTLCAVFSRSGFTDGYLTGKLGSEMFGIRCKDDVVSAKTVLPQLKELFRKETKAVEADFHAVIKKNEPSRLGMRSDGAEITAFGDIPQPAANRPTDISDIEKQLSKLGDTPYELNNVSAEIDGGIVIPASGLNALRREAVAEMNRARLAAKKRHTESNDIRLDFPKMRNTKPKSIHLRLYSAEQLGGVPEYAEIIYLPLDEIIGNWEKCSAFKDKIAAAVPRFTVNENLLREKLSKIKNQGCGRMLCTNIAHIKIGRELGFEMHGDFGLNAANSMSVKAYGEMGITDLTVSFEMKLPQISALGDYIPYGIIAYGRLPLMLTRNCPIKSAVGGCKSCTGGLTDRTGRFFPIKCDGVSSEVLNSDVLVMSDRLGEVNCDFIRLVFTDETADDVREITDCYFNERKIDIPNITRGLYYRGVI
ncbi:MAG: U32 family peptidase [Oscillospiraceae bacterium]|nr:U32 family peptidase [Oscillospiraceae bacterium]